MNQQRIPNLLNKSEAPPGYIAVLKADVATEKLGNICRACDWRPHCDGRIHRCMPYTVITPDGKELNRNDECSVVFKRIEPQAEETTP